MEIANTVAIVTGAGGGIGAAIATALAGAGARVVLTDLNAASVAATALTLRSNGADVAHTHGDAASSEHINQTIALAEKRFGPVDLYVANAGVAGRGGLDATDADWEAVLEVNLMAHIRAARRLLPDWVRRGTGYFVSTASAAGLLTQIGSATYSVTKHAAVGFAEWLNVTYGDDGVRVSCLCPMGVDTALLRPREIDDHQDLLMQRAVETAGPVLSTAEVAQTVLTGIASEQFLILPHPEVLEMYRRKGADYDRWLAGMRRFQSSLRAAPGHSTCEQSIN